MPKMPNTTHTYFAEIAPDGTVLRVLVASPAWIAGQPGTWERTWMDDGQSRPRKNYAGPGHKFDAGRNAFIAPKPRPDAVLDEETCRWMPEDNP